MSGISQFLQKIVVYLRYYFKANTRYRFHSPYLFHLIESCFDAERNYYDFSTLGENYLHLVNRNELISVDEFSQKRNQGGLLIGAFAKKALHPPAQLHELYRLVKYLKPVSILELGACLGSSSVCLALASKSLQQDSVEGNGQFVDIAKELAAKSNCSHIHFHHQDFRKFLSENRETKYDFIMLDGDHSKAATLEYVLILLQMLNDKGVLLLDDIHWSKGMHEAWLELTLHDSVPCSLETSRWGLLFKDKTLSQGRYSYIQAGFKPWQRYV